MIESDQIPQRVELQLVELARIADPQIVKRQVRERDALQLVDLRAQRFDHAVNLTMLALVDRDREPRVLALSGELLHLGRHRHRAVVERHAVAQRLDVRGADLTANLDVIRFWHVVRRREQTRRELTIVGQQQHALGVEVEPPDRLHRHRQVRQVVHHDRAVTIVGHCRDARLGLVEEHVERVERHDRLAVDLDLILVRIDLGAEHANDLAVHPHAARRDQLLGLAPC
ncbi:MAG: hypothetical protein WKG01_04465 [Kofleriaceae bacterium]